MHALFIALIEHQYPEPETQTVGTLVIILFVVYNLKMNCYYSLMVKVSENVCFFQCHPAAVSRD